MGISVRFWYYVAYGANTVGSAFVTLAEYAERQMSKKLSSY